MIIKLSILAVVLIGILYSGIFFGVWSWFYKKRKDPKEYLGDPETFIASFFVGLLWPISGIAHLTRKLLNRWIKE